MRSKTELRGRPASPDRDLVGFHLKVPRPLRARLHDCAAKETQHHPLGLTVSAQALAVTLLDEGLARREKKD
jgi:hypothetical protein